MVCFFSFTRGGRNNNNNIFSGEAVEPINMSASYTELYLRAQLSTYISIVFRLKNGHLRSSGDSPPSPQTSSGLVDSCDVDRQTACAVEDHPSSKTGHGGVHHLQKEQIHEYKQYRHRSVNKFICLCLEVKWGRLNQNIDNTYNIFIS